MAKVDTADIPSFYMNPSAYTHVKDDKKTKSGKTGRTEFSRLFDEFKGKTADELGPLRDLPVSEETVNALMDDVRSTGDVLQNRPFPEEIMRYKQAVRNFINYIVKNSYSVEREEGIPNFLRPGFKGKRGTPEAMEGKAYVRIQVIDRKLEELAAMLLSNQMHHIKLASRLEEIRGLLIDLLQ